MNISDEEEEEEGEEVQKTPSKQQLLYELSQIVFEYMEPNSRFHLSLHLPSLRSVEKGTHLKINKLAFTDNEITVNQTTYKLTISIARQYEISRSIDHDVDEFGFRTNTKDTMMNGDVCMESSSDNEVDAVKRIRLTHEKLGLMEAMKKEEPPECRSTLKLTITSENGGMRIYTSSNITKIYEGMKVLIAAIFGYRTVIWNVECMIISTDNLRWIVSGVRPLVQKIQRFSSVNLDGLRLICHQTSFPLKILHLAIDSRILDHEILVNAENLLIHSGMFTHETDLMKVSNLKVQLFPIRVGFFADLMNAWMEKGRPVGTSWSFEVQRLPFQSEEPSGYIDILRGNARVIESDRRSIKLSMGLSSILSVSYGDPIFHQSINRNNWTLKMEVLKL
ncbi:hypothetical protein B9Z55_000172 [Caenorhabditis nigoni]|uniref:Uncharacterized protein n=1 Tax=Caenorhabditis nigoni TaxID=1611254 RepID=A0A2G5VH38_9PELO|nr:hypothetical protein B9Z55_000172 [Caenorhabditis nigoni]